MGKRHGDLNAHKAVEEAQEVVKSEQVEDNRVQDVNQLKKQDEESKEK